MTLPDVDYHNEKYAVVALGHYLLEVEGWSSVLVVVALESLDRPGGVRGKPLPTIDAERDRTELYYAANFYTDTGGVDLVATKPWQLLLIEAKGKSAKAPVGMEQLVGRTVLSMRTDRADRRHAILIPDLAPWLRAVGAAENPMLAEIGVYAISPTGAIRRLKWGAASA